MAPVLGQGARIAAATVAQVLWSDATIADIEEIHRCIASENCAAADRVAQTLLTIAESLFEMPLRGRGVEGGGRKVLRRPCVILYRVSADGASVTINAVTDGRRIR